MVVAGILVAYGETVMEGKPPVGGMTTAALQGSFSMKLFVSI